jgi:signal transduction histidine kinase
MTRDEAYEAIKSPDLNQRLQAARLFAQSAEPRDVQLLQAALAVETVTWVKSALRQAIARAQPDIVQPSSESENELTNLVSADVFEQIKAMAVNETTMRLVHEIEPILGVLRMRAKQEIPSYDSSRTKVQIDRLGELVRALDRLSRATVAPTLSEFDLAELVARVADGETPDRRVKVHLAGTSPLLVLGDPSLVEIALSNALRNAIEATETVYPQQVEAPAVIVNWGETERDVWVTVLDRGPGPPVAVERAFEIGSTTKENHLGMGLATARQAIRSLAGDVSLGPRAETGGGRLDLRWPRR